VAELTYLDGNAAAGELRVVFAREMTGAHGTSGHCGRVSVLAETRVYTRAPGIVLRCPHCLGVLIRIVHRPDRLSVDVSGVARIELSD